MSEIGRVRREHAREIDHVEVQRIHDQEVQIVGDSNAVPSAPLANGPAPSQSESVRLNAPAPANAPELLASETAPVATTLAPAIKDGKYSVTLVQFPAKKTGLVKVYAPDLFLGNDGSGKWMTKLDDALYSKLVKMSVNDRLEITVKDGRMVKAKRVAKIEADSGVVPGVKKGTTKSRAGIVSARRPRIVRG